MDRPLGAYTYDTNNDSVMEVPGLTLMPGYTEEMTSVFYLTDWYNFLDGEFQKFKSSYVNSSQGYLLDFPEEWICLLYTSFLSQLGMVSRTVFRLQPVSVRAVSAGRDTISCVGFRSIDPTA